MSSNTPHVFFLIFFQSTVPFIVIPDIDNQGDIFSTFNERYTRTLNFIMQSIIRSERVINLRQVKNMNLHIEMRHVRETCKETFD